MSTVKTNVTRLTTEQVNEIIKEMSEYDAIKWVVDHINSHYPKNNIKRPILVSNPTSDQAIEYGLALKIYEGTMEKYKEILADYKIYETKMNTLLEYYITDAADLNSVPDIYRSKLYRMAYQRGHSSGMYSVFQELVELVDIFN